MKSANKKSAGGKPLRTKLGLIVTLAALVLIAVAPMAAGQPTPFLIDGWVNCTNGDPANDPSVTVTNMNTGEVFIAETNASSNYYQVITSSLNVSAGNVLRFNASDGGGNSIEFDHPATQGEMGAGGFEQDAEIDCGGPAGTCGDVNCQNGVTMGDAVQVAMSAIHGTELYPLADPWAADVNCQNGITMGDAVQIAMSAIHGTDLYPLECCD